MANLVIVKVGSDGKVALFSGSTGTTQLIADVSGYYRADGDTGATGTLKALSPSRILDTRSAIGATGPIGPGQTVHLQVAGRGGVPSEYLGAVVMNVTATKPTAAGYVTVFPDGTTKPTSSNLNFSTGQTVPNLVVAKVGTNGRVALYNGSSGTVQLIADVAGYFQACCDNYPDAPQYPGSYATLNPARILDTRVGNGASGPVQPGATVHLQVTGKGGVPAKAVDSVALNLTVTQPAKSGYLTAYPDGTTRPTASNLNFSTGKTVPNLVMAKVGADGKVAVYNGSSSTVQIVADVAGYYISGFQLGSLLWKPLGLPIANNIVPSGVISCSSTTFCMVVATGGAVYVFDGATWRTSTPIPGADEYAEYASVACTSATFCQVMDDQDGSIYGWDGSTWTPRSAFDNSDPDSRVSCTTTSFCMAVTQIAYATWNGSRWSQASFGETSSTRDVSCISTTMCVRAAFGISADQTTDESLVSLWDGTQWGAPTIVNSAPDNDTAAWNGAVSCATSTYCITIDELGHTEAFNGTTWSAPSATAISETIQPFSLSISCASQNFCLAADAESYYAFNGLSWTDQQVLDKSLLYNSFVDVSCPRGTNFCGYADIHGAVATGSPN